MELARTTGPDGVVLREVARRAGVSHNAAYRHFDDRAALLAEVSDRAMSDLEQAMVTRIDAVSLTEPTARATERLRETGRAYVDFALREPGLFAVAFTAPEGPAVHADIETLTGPYAVLNGVLDEPSSAARSRRPTARAPTSRAGRWCTASRASSSTARCARSPTRCARTCWRPCSTSSTAACSLRAGRPLQRAAATAAQPCGTAPRPAPSSGFQYSAKPDVSTPENDMSRILE